MIIFKKDKFFLGPGDKLQNWGPGAPIPEKASTQKKKCMQPRLSSPGRVGGRPTPRRASPARKTELLKRDLLSPTWLRETRNHGLGALMQT